MVGIIAIVASVFVMSFQDALVKFISSDFTLWQIYAIRSAFAIPLTIAIIRVAGRSNRLAKKKRSWVSVRSALLVAMYIAFYAAVPVLNLATIAAGYYTAPLFIALLSALLLKEPVGVWRWVASCIGFIGVLLILKPGTDAYSYLTLLPVLSAFLYALAAIVTRTKCANEEPLAMSLSLNSAYLLVGISVSTVLWLTGARSDEYPFLFGSWASMSHRDWLIMASLAGLIVAISSGVALAYQSGPPATIASFDYAYLVFAVFWGYVFFKEVPDRLSVVGVLLVAAAGVISSRVDSRKLRLGQAGQQG